jgi:hypothetical protein
MGMFIFKRILFNNLAVLYIREVEGNGEIKIYCTKNSDKICVIQIGKIKFELLPNN